MEPPQIIAHRWRPFRATSVSVAGGEDACNQVHADSDLVASIRAWYALSHRDKIWNDSFRSCKLVFARDLWRSDHRREHPDWADGHICYPESMSDLRWSGPQLISGCFPANRWRGSNHFEWYVPLIRPLAKEKTKYFTPPVTWSALPFDQI